MVVAVAPSVANCLLVQQQQQQHRHSRALSVDYQPSSRPLHVRTTSSFQVPPPSNSHISKNMEVIEPLYATVQRKTRPRNTPEDRQCNSLEAFYGGKTISNGAAFIIQRSYRAYRLRKQFSRLLTLAITEKQQENYYEEESSDNEINVDTGLPPIKDIAIIKAAEDTNMVQQANEVAKNSPENNLDLLILQAAGLETLDSIVNKVAPCQRHLKTRKNDQQQQRLRRSASMRTCNRKAIKKASLATKDDISVHQHHQKEEVVVVGSHYEDGPSPPPEPCPALRGHYEGSQVPRPPQRTISFLANQKLPMKVTQQRPLPPPPPHHHVSFNSDVGLYDHVKHYSSSSALLHSRSYSSPAPLSPQAMDKQKKSNASKDHMVIEIPALEEPLPPPPYISPPIYSGASLESSPSMPSPPPPPPPQTGESTTLVSTTQVQRPPCDSSSSASSIDSGFRSSCLESPTHWNIGSPHLIASPESLGVIQDVVFEPRGNPNNPTQRLQQTCQQHQNHSQSSLQRNNYEFPPQRNYSAVNIKKQKTVRINPEPLEHQLTSVDEVTRRRQYRVGLNLFNQYPEIGIEYLCKKDFVDYSPVSVGKFLRGRKGLSKNMIGFYLCQLQRQFNIQALHCFVHEMDFTGLHLDIALRHLYQEVSPPASEAQKIEKMIEVFARRYIICNQMFASGFRSPDTIFVLSYAIVLLNTDLHSKAVKSGKRMKREDFVNNLKGVDLGADLDPEMLQGIYDRIKASELKPGPDHVSQVARVEETMIKSKKGGHQQFSKQPLASDTSRRLVCFCRLSEVPDVHKKTKAKADAHQRGVFVFNDLLVVTKTLSKKDKTQHQFRTSIDLRTIRINVFSTAQYPFGIQLQDKLTGKVVATFNARSDADQQKFVTDLEECIAEQAEMELAKSVLNDENFLNQVTEDNAYETLC